MGLAGNLSLSRFPSAKSGSDELCIHYMEITKAHIKEMNDLAREIVRDAQSTMDKALQLGSMLTKTKEAVPHGEWESWVDANMEITARTARSYMQCWASRAVIRAEKIIELKDAYKLLSAPPPPPSTVKISPNTEQKDQIGKHFPISAEIVPTKSKPEIVDAVELDSIGWPIPEKALPYWNRKQEIQDILTELSKLKGLLKAKQEEDDPMWREVNFSGAIADLSRLWTNIQTAKPYVVCPTCQGKLPEKCAHCRGRGLLSEFRWSAVDKDTKAMREKLKGQARV